MSAEYGIFSEAAGGCIYSPCHSIQEAEQERDRMVAEDGEEAEDLTIEELCPDHEEQTKNGCEECAEGDVESEAEDEEGVEAAIIATDPAEAAEDEDSTGVDVLAAFEAKADEVAKANQWTIARAEMVMLAYLRDTSPAEAATIAAALQARGAGVA